MRRLCYAFSKRLPNHRAAIALNYLWYNVGTVVSTLRVTPAMAANVTDHIWTLEEFLVELLAAEQCDKPEKQPLKVRMPEEPARELPNGRGFLRLVGGSGTPKASSAPVEPPPVPAAAAPLKKTVEPGESKQMDLFAWRPRPRKSEQLNLF